MSLDWLYEDASLPILKKNRAFHSISIKRLSILMTRDVLTKEVRFIYSFVFSQQTFIDDNTDIPSFFL